MQKQEKMTTVLSVNSTDYEFYDLKKAGNNDKLKYLPLTAKILLENLLRHANQAHVKNEDIESLINWDNTQKSQQEIAFVPSRVILQDFTGVPAVVDLAAMRDAIDRLGGDASKINPLKPVDLVIDHSIMVDEYGAEDSFQNNTRIEVERNKERYQFLKWGQHAFDNFKVVPPGKGIVHQINLEYLAQVTFCEKNEGHNTLYPDTLVGTDSHTTMINGLGVLGWGVGGIEAEAAMLGQPVTMLIPEIVGMQLKGSLPAGATATDLVLAVTEKLRKFGVVGKFVEFFGDGIKDLSLADRATISNMAPEYGATCGLFPVDEQTINYLRLTGRELSQLELIEAYSKAQDMWGAESLDNAKYHETLSLDLTKVVPSIAGPKRPQDRINLTDAANAFEKWIAQQHELKIKVKDIEEGKFESEGGQQREQNITAQCEYKGQKFELSEGAVVIAAITSCTNTSNPSVLIAAALMAKKANQLGMHVKPWVKTSFAPGSQVVSEYLQKADLSKELDALGFNLVGYGCTTCIGNSGPLSNSIAKGIKEADLTVTSVLSGNRNFEGRIHQDVKANYLASPPLVVAYALAGNMKVDICTDALGKDKHGNDVFLEDIWPSNDEITKITESVVQQEMFIQKYNEVYEGGDIWDGLDVSDSNIYDWPDSTYVKRPPFFEKMTKEPRPIKEIKDARCLLKLGDSVTTDHISPAGSIGVDTPASEYLQQEGVAIKEFNSYGSRRGNHEVMMRGTFANIRLRNQLAPGTEGGITTMQANGKQMSVFAAAEQYKQKDTPTIVLAGKEYGTGSSRDWAAKGPLMLGISAVVAQSYERIHRSNLIGMGILPLQFKEGESAEHFQLDGSERFTIEAISPTQKTLNVKVLRENEEQFEFEAQIRIDTPNEYEYYSHGGILQFVIRNMLKT